MPNEVSKLEWVGDWFKTYDNKQFVLANDGTEDKIVVFATEENLSILYHSDEVFMDGTFKTCPSIFKQIYIFHGYFMGKLFPLVYALLTGKSQTIYERLFTLLNEKIVELNNTPLQPLKFRIDFELAAINSIRNIYPNNEIQVLCCYFH